MVGTRQKQISRGWTPPRWYAGALILAAAVAMLLAAVARGASQPTTIINATSDVRKLGQPCGSWRVYQADTLEVNVWALDGAGPLNLGATNLSVMMYVVTETNRSSVSIVSTGTVVSTTNGQMRFPIASSNTVLAPDDYLGLVKGWISEGGTNDPRTTFATLQLEWLYSPEASVYPTVTPIDVDAYLKETELEAGTNIIISTSTNAGKKLKISTGSNVATGTPLYAESDPIWASTAIYYEVHGPGVTHTPTGSVIAAAAGDGTNDNVEYPEISGIVGTGANQVAAGTEPIWSGTAAYYRVFGAGVTHTPTGSIISSSYATGIPVYAESDPLWAATAAYYRVFGSGVSQTPTGAVIAAGSGFPMTSDGDMAGYSMTNGKAIAVTQYVYAIRIIDWRYTNCWTEFTDGTNWNVRVNGTNMLLGL